MDLVGKSIRGFKLLRKIGSGGMGDVYYAFHDKLKREAAVKVLFDKSMADRFKNEAYIQSSVNHPNIANLYEYGLIEGAPCIVMEYVNGISLDKYILQSPLLSSEKVDEVFEQVCNAVSYLHQRGIQHRDIKPSNIKIKDDGTVKLLDFGVSKAKYSPKLTKEGYIVGTTDFMAPEQFRSINSLKSDIWSLGVLLYFLTTKQFPFEGQNILKQRRQIEKSLFTKPSILNPLISQKHSDLIIKMLSVNRQKRPSIEQVLQSIQEAETPVLVFFQGEYLRKYALPVLLILGSVIFFWLSKKEAPVSPNEDVVSTTFRQIEVVVQNSNDVEIILPDNTNISKAPYIVQKPLNESLELVLKEGKYNKKITIPADFNQDRFMCTMEY